MSSFRIDRQYVSFVSAETKPVYATGQLPDAKAPFESTGADGMKELSITMEQRCEEILTRTQKEADEKAAHILLRARADAEKIIGNAKHLAGEMIEKANGSAEEIREEAKRVGYAEGEKSAQMCAEVKKSEEAKEFSQLVDKLRQDYAALVDGMKEDAISLIIDIVRKIINFRINESDDTFLLLVNHAIEQLKQTGEITIHVGSEDYARYFGKGFSEKILYDGKAKVVVAEEESYSTGDLVVESEGEIVDYSLSRQIERVEKALKSKGD